MKKVKSALSILLAVLMLAGCLVTASAAEIEETEPNETAATATAFETGKKIEGILASAADVDYYKFTPAKTGLATITFEHAAVTGADASVTYFDVAVYDSDSAEAAAVAEITSAGSSTSDKAELIVIAEKTYYIAVDMGMVYDGTVGYSLNVTVDESIASESEPNNTLDKADALEVSVSGNAKYYYGAISGNDVDYYKVTVPSNGVINLYLYNEFSPKGNFNAVLMTMTEGANGVQTEETVTSISVTDKEETKIGPSVCVAAGEYILVINGDVGSYKTRVFFRAVSNTETENNDSTIQADEIAVGTSYKATLDEAADKDCFKFTAPASNKGYDVTFKATNNAKWNVKILNSDGEAVADALKFTSTDSTKSAKIETYPLDAGTYYIEVTAGEVHDADIYEINVTEKAEALDDGSDDNMNLWEKIQALNWGALADNLAGWFDQIDLKGMISDIFASIAMVVTLFSSMGK